MSYADLHYEDLMIEQAMNKKAVEVYFKRYSNQKIVKDAIKSFTREAVDESSKLEQVAREILKTVARTKTLSTKQKTCLIRVLVERMDSEYEAKFRI